MFRRRKHDDDDSDEDEDDDIEEEAEKKVGLHFDTVNVPYALLTDLRSALIEGKGLSAAREVGDFPKGGVLLAGADLNLKDLGIQGLDDGDFIDAEIQHLALEAIAGLADDALDAKVNVRPLWQVTELLEKEKKKLIPGQPCRNRLRRLRSFLYKCCCTRRKWKRKRSIRERLQACKHACASSLLNRCLKKMSGPEKRYDIFLACQDADNELAEWMLKFCGHRAFEVFFETPCMQARKQKMRQLEKEQAEAAEDDDDDEEKGKVEEDKKTSPSGKGSKASPRSRASSRSSSRGVQCLEWLRRRQMAIISSNILVVCLSSDSFENGWVILDCVTAYSAGIPIVPIRRNLGEDVDEHYLRAELKWVFSLGIGLLRAGPGANRQQLFIAVSRAITKGSVKAAYSKKKKKLPAGTVDALMKSFLRLRLEAERGLDKVDKPRGRGRGAHQESGDDIAIDIADADANPSEEAENSSQAEKLLQGESPRQAESGRESHGSARSATSARGSPPASARGSPMSARGIMSPRSARGVHSTRGARVPHSARGREPVGSPGTSPRGTRMGGPGSPGASPRGTRMGGPGSPGASPRMSPRRSPNASPRVDAARLQALSEAGGHQSLAELRKAAEAELQAEEEARRQELAEEEAAMRLNSSLEERVYGVIAALALHGADYRDLSIDAASALRRVAHNEKGCVTIAEFGGMNVVLKLAHSANKHMIIKAKNQKRGKSMFGFFGGTRSLGTKSVISGKSGRSTRAGAKSARFTRMTFHEIQRSKSQISGLEDGTAELGTGWRSWLSVRSTQRSFRSKTSTLSETSSPEKVQPEIKSEREDKEYEDDEVNTAVNALACLRNLACRSQDRKLDILNAGGAQVAVKSLKVFTHTEEAEDVRTSAAGLLRNLSAEVATSSPILMTAGLLSVAEDELVGSTIKSDLQRHLLATVQNMAAHPDAPNNYFSDESSQKWLDVCAELVASANAHEVLEEKQKKILQQALSALANLALVRSRVLSSGDAVRRSTRDDKSSDGPSETACKTRVASQLSVEEDEAATTTDSKSEQGSVAKSGSARSERLGPQHPSRRLKKRSFKGSAAKGKAKAAPKKAMSAKSMRKRRHADASGSWGASFETSQEQGWGQSFDGSIGKPTKKARKRLESVREEMSDDEDAEEEEEHQEEGEGEEEEPTTDDDEDDYGEGGEGGESEELEYDDEEEEEEDEEEEEEDEQTSSIPTDALDFEASLQQAEKKVSSIVLNSMLTLLRPDAEKNPLTAVATIAALCNFAQDVDVERSIGTLGGLELVLEAMSHYKDSQVVLQCLRFLWNMTFSRHNQTRLIEADGLPMIISTLTEYRGYDDAMLQEQGCGVLRNISTGTARMKRQVYNQGGISILVNALSDYHDHPGACIQAAAGIRVLAEGAPPVAEEVCDQGGMRALIRALKSAGDDTDLMENFLHAVELVLISPVAAKPFCESKGHIEVIGIIERFPNQWSTMLRCCRVLAAAMVLHRGYVEDELADSDEEEQDNSEYLGSPKSGSPRSSVREDPSARGDSPRAGSPRVRSSKSAKQIEIERQEEKERVKKLKAAQGPRIASLRMRLELLNQSVVEKLCNGITTFKDNLGVLEAIVGALRNLVMDIPGVESELLKALKPETGDRSDSILKVTLTYVRDAALRHQSARFVSLVLSLFCSLSLNVKATSVLHRQTAGEKALDWMQLYSHDDGVQVAGCAFLKNFAASQLRIRQYLVEIGAVGQIADLLESFLNSTDVLEEAMRTLHNLAMADGCGVDAAENFLPRRVFKVLDTHKDIATLNAVGFALLWNVSTTNLVNKAIVVQNGVQRSVSAVRRFPNAPGTIGSIAGMLRNLLAGDDAEEVSHKIHKEGGYKTLREALFKHRDHPMMVEQIFAVFSNVCILCGAHLDFMCSEFMSAEEAKRTKQVLELHPKAAPVQYQGFAMIGRLVAYDLVRKPCFNIIIPHALMMLTYHRNTPVVDMVESVLEEIG